MAFASFSQVDFVHNHSKCAAMPNPVTINQPDGTDLTIVGHGNMDENYTETVDGFTVIKNKEGVYEYASLKNVGSASELIASGIKAYNQNHAEFKQVFFPKHLRPVKTYADAPSNANIIKENDPNSPLQVTLSGSVPNKGKIRIPLLFVEYPDLRHKYTRNQLFDLMMKPNYNNKSSFRDFYLETSDGLFEIEFDTFGWYTSEEDYKYYGNSNSRNRVRELISQLTDSANADGANFSNYDNDNDGFVDGVMVIHSGPGAEEGAQNDYIWSHRWSLTGSYSKIYDGVRTSSYAINPETRSNGTRMVGIGVMVHEFGHLLGLPDLYDTEEANPSSGLGNWCLMAGGPWLDLERTPAGMSAWCKYVLDWASPIDITEDGIYNLKPTTKSQQIYKLNTSNPSVYFLLENRQRHSYDYYIPGHGLAIFRINEGYTQNTLGSNSVNADANNYGIKMIQADGDEDLEGNSNRGDNGDIFPGAENVRAISDDTEPGFADGLTTLTGLSISGIKVLSDSSVEFAFGAFPQALFNLPTAVCLNEEVYLVNESKYSSKFEWEFPDGSVDTNRNLTVRFLNAATYEIKLRAYNKDSQFSETKKTINVSPRAEISIEYRVSNDTIYITNNTTDAQSILWRMSDGVVGSSIFFSLDKELVVKYDITKAPDPFNIRVIATGNNGCNDTAEFDIPLKGNVNIIDNKKSTDNLVSIFPNPTQNIVNFNVAYEALGGNLAIMDLTGKVILQKNISSINSIVEMGQYPKGIYSYSYSTPNGNRNVGKIVVK